jgi:hypothetical protein
MEKPHRFLIDRVSSYAEEGGAFLRRRRLRGRRFARVWRPGGGIDSLDPASGSGRELLSAAEALLGASEPATTAD